MGNQAFWDSPDYSKFYSEFIDAINDKNNPKYSLAFQHVHDVILKMYARGTISEKINSFPSKKTKVVSGYISGITNVSNLNFVALPIPYPKIQFDRCKLASIAILKLIDRLSQDNQFIVSNFSAITDDFMARLYNIYQMVYLKNHSNGAKCGKKPGVRCYLNRSDFVIDGGDSTTNLCGKSGECHGKYCNRCISYPCICTINDTEWPKLIETNCIAVAHSTHSTSLHRILGQYTDQLADITASVAKTIHLAIETNQTKLSVDSSIMKMERCVLVVYYEIGTIFDWGKVGTALQDEYRITVFYHTLAELVKMYECKQLKFDGDDLTIVKFDATYAIKLIYLRSCYIPQHINGEEEWNIMGILELCNAVKVPSVATQLVCSKLGQMIWSARKFIDKLHPQLFEPILNTKIDQCDPARNMDMKHLAIENPYKFVLKNHLEGGHGIFFNQKISETLKNGIGPNEYILAKRIFPPLQKAIFVSTDADRQSVECRVDNSVTEVGIYSFGIFTHQSGETADECSECNAIIEIPGYLSRTKTPETTGGGICSGYAHLSTLKII